MTPAERLRAADVVLAAARQAAAVVLGVYERPFDVEYKGRNDPVTAADRAANALLCEALLASFPGVPVVAEESDPSSYAGFHEAEAAWFVDPLDGTRDFVKRNGEFVVMVGLAEGGRATLGVIVVPVTGVAYVGGEGVPAVEVDPSGRRAPIAVSRVATLAEAEIVVSRSRRQGGLDRAAERLGVRAITSCGSAGLKGIRVATGEADLYAQPGLAGNLWDACAPDALLVAAGGVVSDAFGDAIPYRSPDLPLARGLLAANRALHPAALELMRASREEGA